MKQTTHLVLKEIVTDDHKEQKHLYAEPNQITHHDAQWHDQTGEIYLAKNVGIVAENRTCLG